MTALAGISATEVAELLDHVAAALVVLPSESASAPQQSLVGVMLLLLPRAARAGSEASLPLTQLQSLARRLSVDLSTEPASEVAKEDQIHRSIPPIACARS